MIRTAPPTGPRRSRERRTRTGYRRVEGHQAPAMVREEQGVYGGSGVEDVAAGFGQAVTCVRALAARIPDRSAGRSLAAAGHLDADTLERWVADLRRVEGALAAVKAAVVVLGDVTQVAEAAGMASTGQWVRRRFDSSSREAAKQQQLADSLERLPEVRRAVADGSLGPEQAAILGQAARRGRLGAPDEVEATLLDTASRSSPERLREQIRRTEQRVDGDALRRDENRQHALRRASCVKTEDGMWRLDAMLPGVDGELFATALAAFTLPDAADAPPHLQRRPEQRTADGLIALGRVVLDQQLTPQTGGLRPHLMVLVPYDGPDPWHPGLLDGARTRSGRSGPARTAAETAAGTALSPDATHRLLCDARITRIVLSGRSRVLDVGRTTRTWTAAQRAALVARDRGCRGPGCDRPAAWCDAHHVTWWSAGGSTDVANGVLLCHHHHRLVHDGGWSLRVDATTGVAVFTDLAGREHTTRPTPDTDHAAAPHAALGARSDGRPRGQPTGGTPRGDGEGGAAGGDSGGAADDPDAKIGGAADGDGGGGGAADGDSGSTTDGESDGAADDPDVPGRATRLRLPFPNAPPR